jgi:hypothetical protein
LSKCEGIRILTTLNYHLEVKQVPQFPPMAAWVGVWLHVLKAE